MAKFIKRDSNIFSDVYLQKFDLSSLDETNMNYLVVGNNTIALLVRDKEVVSVKKPGTYKLNGLGLESAYISQELYAMSVNASTDKPIAITFSDGEFILFKFSYYLNMNWKDNIDNTILKISSYEDVKKQNILDYIEKAVRANVDDIFLGLDTAQLRDDSGNFINSYLMGEKLRPFLKELLESIGLKADVNIDLVSINDPSFYDEYEENEDRPSEEKLNEKKNAYSSFMDDVLRDTFKANSSEGNQKSIDENFNEAFINNLFGDIFGKK